MLLSALLMPAACVIANVNKLNAHYKYPLYQDFAENTLASPKVGFAVFVYTLPEAAQDAPSLVSGFENAIAHELQGRGYQPTHLYSQVLEQSISVTFPPNWKGLVDDAKVVELMPTLRDTVLAPAAAQGLAGVFVVWVSATRTMAAATAVQGYTTTYYSPETPLLAGSSLLEIFSAQGEALSRYVGRLYSFSLDEVHPDNEGRMLAPAWSPREAAARCMSDTFGKVHPYSGAR